MVVKVVLMIAVVIVGLVEVILVVVAALNVVVEMEWSGDVDRDV